MITPNTIKKSQAKKILKLIEQATRAEILSRLAPIPFPEYADWHMVSIEKRNELLQYLYGTSSFVELGRLWGLLKKERKPNRKQIKKERKKK